MGVVRELCICVDVCMCVYVMVKMAPPKLVPPGTYFTAKYGLPLKNLDHLTQMKKRIDPEHISVTKFRPVASLRVIEVCGNYSGKSHNVQASFPAEPHAVFDCAYIAQLFL